MATGNNVLSQEILSTISAKVDALSKELREVSLKMHSNPEVGWQEWETAKLLTEYIENKGFTVKRGVYGTETGWEAVFKHGSGGKVIGFNCEMDALPGLGHACGHNLIAIIGLGSALALVEAFQKHDINGTIKILGTPAEECTGDGPAGGKVVMLREGGYADMDVCLMAHPAPASAIASTNAISGCEVSYQGKSAHAGAAPWQGHNALDAAVCAYNNLSVLRQQLHPSSRLHGIIKSQDDWACNVIPAKSELVFAVRHPDVEEANKLKERTAQCFDAAARATGCTHTLEWTYDYKNVVVHDALAAVFQAYMQDHEDFPMPTVKEAWGASTDFGDVTHALPAIHPMYRIPVGSPDAQNHTIGFAEAAKTPESHEATISVIKGLTVTAYKFATDEEFVKKVKKEFQDTQSAHK